MTKTLRPCYSAFLFCLFLIRVRSVFHPWLNLFSTLSIGHCALMQASVSAADDNPRDLMVWTAEHPTGKTWAKLGPKGGLTVGPDKGVDDKGKCLVLRIDGDGWSGCGLNWKGWYPADAGDDVAKFNSLIFHIRQVSKFDHADLGIRLVDNIKRADDEPASHTVQIVGSGALKQINGDWQRVVLPLRLFTQNRPLDLKRLWGIDFFKVGNDPVAFDIDRIGFARIITRFKAGPAVTAKGFVQPDKELHTIHDEIYGVCDWPRDKLAEYAIPITRWGGNTSTRYNWKLNVTNSAADWYFKNHGPAIDRLADTAYLKNIEIAKALGGTCYQTVPMIGWVSKDATSYSFSVAKYGKQKATEPGHPDVGDGIKLDGKMVTGNDPHDTSIEAPPEFVGDAVRFVVHEAGKADAGGVKYWVLDNEPMLWNSTHRDVHPKPLSYDGLWDRTVKYGEIIKRADASAKVAGYCSWGWTDLFYSAADVCDNAEGRPDCAAHDKIPLCEWYLRKCAAYKKAHDGTNLVDVLDVHWYPQGEIDGQGIYRGRSDDPALCALRLRSTRDLWDTKYQQESWIRKTTNPGPVALIPRIRKWIETNDPGMMLSLGEYNYGGSDNVSGGLAQAELFGIFARERLDLAFIWSHPEGSQESAWKLFRNYDGAKGRFGNRFLECSSEHADISMFAARRTEDKCATIVIVNKNLHSPCTFSLDLNGLAGTVRVWRFDQDHDNQVVEVEKAAGNTKETLTLELPAASASMVVIKPER